MEQPHTSQPEDGGHSRVTALARLTAAAWLLATAGPVLGNPPAASAQTGLNVETLLVLESWHFALGMFLLFGFMSRLAGLGLAGISVWQVVTLGWSWAPPLLVLVGAYVLLRGGGAWATDVYVNHMQERVRQREAAEAAAREAAT